MYPNPQWFIRIYPQVNPIPKSQKKTYSVGEISHELSSSSPSSSSFVSTSKSKYGSWQLHWEFLTRSGLSHHQAHKDVGSGDQQRLDVNSLQLHQNWGRKDATVLHSFYGLQDLHLSWMIWQFVWPYDVDSLNIRKLPTLIYSVIIAMNRIILEMECSEIQSDRCPKVGDAGAISGWVDFNFGQTLVMSWKGKTRGGFFSGACISVNMILNDEKHGPR